jgi:hypothetical protein
MIKNANPLPHFRRYSYLGATVEVVWIYRWSHPSHYLVDILYEGAQEATRLIKWDPELFVELPQAA